MLRAILLPLGLLSACTGAKPDDSGTNPADSASDTSDSDSSYDVCQDPAGLREDVTTNGTVVLDGITMASSTPLADIVADPGSFDGQAMQIEGVIVEVCQTKGCYTILSDGDSHTVVLKVEDGAFDFRDVTDTGYYAVGEGTFSPTGEYGPQVQISGAMVGTIQCAF